MKIEVDMSGIFEGEDGSTLTGAFAERLEAAIVEHASEMVDRMVRDLFEREVKNQITNAVKTVLGDLITKTLDEQYVPTNEWGYREEQITLRNRICKDIERALKWKDSSYSNGTDVYNKIIKEVVSEKLKEFSNEFTKTIDDQFIAACMEHAIEVLKHKTRTV